MINNKIKKYLFPIHSLTNIDIDNYFKDIGLKEALITKPKDMLNRHPLYRLLNDECIVINLDDAEGEGTHWILVCNSSNEDSVLYYDSYGVKYIPQEIEDYLRTSNKPIDINDGQHQFLGSILCGYYCLKVAKSIFKDGMSYKEAIDLFSDNPSMNNRDLADNLML